MEYFFFKNVIFRYDDTGGVEVVQHPANPQRPRGAPVDASLQVQPAGPPHMHQQMHHPAAQGQTSKLYLYV